MIGLIVSRKFDVQAQHCVAKALSCYSTRKFNIKKEKWDHMKSAYINFKFILDHTGFGWDLVRYNVDATMESWENLLLV